MEFHDRFWKIELSNFRDQIARVRLHDGSETEDFFIAERPVQYSAFIIRKLIEDTAVTDKLKSKSLSLFSSPSARNGNPVFLEAMLGPRDIEEDFDLSIRNQERLSFFDLASEIIHADGLIWSFDDEEGGFLVFSYRNALNRALWVPVEMYLSVIDQVLKDQPTRWYSSKDLATGKVTRHAE